MSSGKMQCEHLSTTMRPDCIDRYLYSSLRILRHFTGIRMHMYSNSTSILLLRAQGQPPRARATLASSQPGQPASHQQLRRHQTTISMSKNVSMYHYTTEDGIRGMLQSGQINESHDTRRDCLHGVGVYGTAVVP